MRKLTSQEKNKVGRIIQVYNSHINLTTIPVVLFYYYNHKSDSKCIGGEIETAKDYFTQNCSSRDYIETMFLIRLLEDNGLIYLDGKKNITKKEYIDNFSNTINGDDIDCKEIKLGNKLTQMPEEIACTIARHYNSNAYINSGLIDLYERDFKTIEEEELECTRKSLKRSKSANRALWWTLIFTILFQGANTFYDYIFNKIIPTNITISNIKSIDSCPELIYFQQVENDIKWDTTKIVE